MKPEVWVVRADKPIVNIVERGLLVAIGWPKMGDLSKLNTKDEFQKNYQRIYCTTSCKVTNAANQLYRFVKEIQKEDYVLTPLSVSREILIGKITGDYHYDPNAISVDYPHVRTVRWEKKLSRDILPPKLKGSSGSIMTVFNLSKYLSEIEELVVMT